MQLRWTQQDGVTLRDFFTKISPEDLKKDLMDECPAKLTAEIMLKTDDANIARLSAMRAGWEGAIDALIARASVKGVATPVASYQDMT